MDMLTDQRFLSFLVGAFVATLVVFFGIHRPIMAKCKKEDAEKTAAVEGAAADGSEEAMQFLRNISVVGGSVEGNIPLWVQGIGAIFLAFVVVLLMANLAGWLQSRATSSSLGQRFNTSAQQFRRAVGIDRPSE
jgi:hypothetical protein